MRSFLNNFGSALALAFAAWLIYLIIKTAQHVQAWPF